MKISILPRAFLALFTAISCTQKEEKNFIAIPIDFEAVQALDLSDKQEVNLEISDSSIVKRVDEFFVKDDKIFLRSDPNLFLFRLDGKFVAKIGNKGEDPHEYLSFSSFFLEDDKIHLYDAMGRKMPVYDLHGNFIRSISLLDQYSESRPSYIQPMKGGKFIAKNTYGGKHRNVPSYSILGNDYAYVANIGGRFLKNGIITHNNFFCNDHETLFWELLNDTVFSINDTTYSEKYFVDFKEKALPNSIKKLDLYNALALSNKPENIEKYATLIRNVSEDDRFLRFTFVHNREIYWVKYDKRSKKAKTYKLEHANGTIEPTLYFDGKQMFIPVNKDDNPDLNPSIIILNETAL